ncbi:MAG: outer membrane beta-barrel protein [Nibricoccus sp.]
MKYPSLFMMAFAVSSIAAVAQTSPSASGTTVYIQPSAAIIVPGDDFETGGGGLIAFGVQFAENHHLEVETGFLISDIKDSQLSMGFIPAVLNYKYAVPLSERFSLHAGASAGAMFQKLGYRTLGNSYGETKSSATFGLNAGVFLRLSERLSLDAGGRVLRIDKTSYTTEGNVVIFHAGLNIRL